MSVTEGLRLSVALAALALGLAAPALAHGATWTPVSGQIAGRPVNAVTDGSRTLVGSIDRREVVVTTLAGTKVASHQVVGTGSIVRGVRVLLGPGGSAVAVWDAGGRILGAYRPTRTARFRAATEISRHPGAATGAARGVVAAAGPGGRVLATWWGGPAGGRLGIHASELGAGGAWSVPVEISAGTYPQLGLGAPPIVAIAAAGAPGGGYGVVWRQPAGTATAIVSAQRTAAGAWQAPAVLGTGDVTSFGLAAAATDAGEVVGVWSEARSRRPDGVVDATCGVAGIATATGTVSKRDVWCRPTADPGRARLLTTAGGGTLAAWQLVPDLSAGGLDQAAVDLFARAPGTADWSAGALAIAGARDLEDLGAASGARSLLVAEQPRNLRVAIIAPDGTVRRRIDGPRTPGRGSNGDRRFVALGAGPRAGILVWPLPGFPYRYRASLLTLGPA